MRAMAYAGTILIGYFAMKSELLPPPSRTHEVLSPGMGREKQWQKRTVRKRFPRRKNLLRF